MARESRRRRHAILYGEDQTFAAKIINDEKPFVTRSGSSFMQDENLLRETQASIAESPVIKVDNVRDFMLQNPRESWVYTKDFPTVSPPFRSFFMEFREKDNSARLGKGQYGFFFSAVDADVIRDYHSRNNRKFSIHPSAKWFLYALPFISFSGRSVYFHGSVTSWDFQVDDSGAMVEGMAVASDNRLPDEEADIVRELSESLSEAFCVCLLAISFMNCKNTTLRRQDPDPGLNRARRKAGREPLLSYHTIDIEPMRKVLRDEGHSESTGIKQALHICRGHFSTYTPERPLFGRLAGTFWVPSHVRGSLSEGVVVSDYNVKQPGPTGDTPATDPGTGTPDESGDRT